ncbi:hypothetical protein [Vibrio cholerae]|uniref:hypothetical protein n=1 Tax=Vibrio cholerae TaxID=666 RepID=UPI000E6D489A|nr:hypothetical protein [Vibrio cholerae]AYC07031.1 hypothetical protein FORC73_3080 [Vibrio cholerae]
MALVSIHFSYHEIKGCWSGSVYCNGDFAGIFTFETCKAYDDTAMFFSGGSENPTYVTRLKNCEGFVRNFHKKAIECEFRKQDEAPVMGADSSSKCTQGGAA